MDDFDRAMAVLIANNNKSFVKRILEPQSYPTLDLGNGQHATHRMMWGQAGDKYVVFPSVLLNGKGQLVDYGDKAWDHVMSSGNFIEFDNPDDAAWFSENYKSAWGGKRGNRP